jgi:hypothetical protein
LEIDPSDFKADNATLKGDNLWPEVEIVIRGVPTILEVRFMYLIMSLGRIMLQGSISTNLFGPMRHIVDLQKVDVGIQPIGNIYLAADIILPGIHFTPVLGRLPRISIRFLVYLSLLHSFRSQGVGISLHIFAGSPE